MKELPAMLGLSCVPEIPHSKTEVGGLGVQGQPGSHNGILSFRKRKTNVLSPNADKVNRGP